MIPRVLAATLFLAIVGVALWWEQRKVEGRLTSLTTLWRRWRQQARRRREDASREMLGRVSRRTVALVARRELRARRRLEEFPRSPIEIPEKGRTTLWRTWP